MVCSVDDCERGLRARGLCNAHYKRWHRLGDLLTDKPVQITRDDATRFWRHVEKTSGCWLWTGALTLHGYPRYKTREKQHQAHRYSYELLRGPIAEGLELDHLCRVRHCVNPSHLDPVSHQENIVRGHAARRAAMTGGQ